jgi:hypothetical protein
MIAKLIATALSAALVLGTASATFAASNNKKQAAPRKATVTTAPQPDNAYRSFARQPPTTQPVREAPATQPVREERIPDPPYFGFATGR